MVRPAIDAGIALARLHERIARSPVGTGFIERTQFADACASLWIDGELVHLEDLVLHDAFRDTRTPTHELGMKEYDRLVLAKTMMDRKLAGRRTSSKLPELVDLVMVRPLVLAGMVAKTLDVTPQAARRIVLELASGR